MGDFTWASGTLQLTATVRPVGFRYHHHHFGGHVCSVPTLEVRDRTKVQLLMPVAALEEIEPEGTLADLFQDMGTWFEFLAWVYAQDPEPVTQRHETSGVTDAQPLLTARDQLLLKGRGLKFQNRGLVDQDYVHKLNDAVRAWLARFIDHTVENRWRYDSGDLIEPGSPLARQLYRDNDARKQAMRIIPDRVVETDDGCLAPDPASGNPEQALTDWIDARQEAEHQELSQVEQWLRSKRRW